MQALGEFFLLDAKRRLETAAVLYQAKVTPKYYAYNFDDKEGVAGWMQPFGRPQKTRKNGSFIAFNVKQPKRFVPGQTIMGKWEEGLKNDNSRYKFDYTEENLITNTKCLGCIPRKKITVVSRLDTISGWNGR